MKMKKENLLLRFEKGTGWYLKRDFDMRTAIDKVFSSRNAAIKWCEKNGYGYID